jgi:hypothetical protein
MFMKHEDDIDSFLEQAKNESYKQVENIMNESKTLFANRTPIKIR